VRYHYISWRYRSCHSPREGIARLVLFYFSGWMCLCWTYDIAPIVSEKKHRVIECRCVGALSLFCILRCGVSIVYKRVVAVMYR